MNPSEYYKRLIASITEDDVRRVAEVMAVEKRECTNKLFRERMR